MSRAFSPFPPAWSESWGFAPGWYESGRWPSNLEGFVTLGLFAEAALGRSIRTLRKGAKGGATGDVAGAKSDLAKLQGDLKKQESGSADGTPSALDKLVTKLADALKTGSTADALQDVASYLATTGLGSGSLLNVSG